MYSNRIPEKTPSIVNENVWNLQVELEKASHQVTKLQNETLKKINKALMAKIIELIYPNSQSENEKIDEKEFEINNSDENSIEKWMFNCTIGVDRYMWLFQSRVDRALLSWCIFGDLAYLKE